MNWSHNELILSILSVKPSRIIEGGKMKTSYEDAVGVGVKGHVLQSLPRTHPLNYGVKKSG